MSYKKNLLSIYPIKDKSKDKYYFGITATYPHLENYNSDNNEGSKINNLQEYHTNDSTAVFFQKYFTKLGYKTVSKRPVQCKLINEIDNILINDINIENYDLDKSLLIFTGHSYTQSNKIHGNFMGNYNPSKILLKYFKDYNNIPKNILFYNCYGANKMCLNLDINIVRDRNIYCIRESVSRKSGVKEDIFFNKKYDFYKFSIDSLDNTNEYYIHKEYTGRINLQYFFKEYFII